MDLMLEKHEFDELTGVTFLQPCKKVTKEDGIGEALTAKPIGTFCLSNLFPRLRAALPYVPLPALDERLAVVVSISGTVEQTNRRQSRLQIRAVPSPRRGPGGGLGEGGAKPG